MQHFSCVLCVLEEPVHLFFLLLLLLLSITSFAVFLGCLVVDCLVRHVFETLIVVLNSVHITEVYANFTGTVMMFCCCSHH